MWDMYRMFVIPEGKWGEKGAAMMVGSGDAMARQAVELLELRQNDRVLEIGFGPGIGLETLAKKVTHGSVVGIDPSELMHRLAGERNEISIETGLVKLLKGTVDHLPFEDSYFNGALAMDNMHFWNDPLKALKDLHRVLMPGAKLVSSFTPFSGGSRRGWKELFTAAGFTDFAIFENESGIRLVGTAAK
ncbi:class I SAM-dependent methyltransferase [Empedobacter falsenii]